MKKAATVPGWKSTGLKEAFCSDCTPNNPIGNGQAGYLSEPGVIIRLTIILLTAVTFFWLGGTTMGVAAAQDEETAVPESTPSPQETETPAAGGGQEIESAGPVDALVSADWPEILGALLSVAVIILVAFYGGKALYILLRRLARRTESTLDDELLEVIRPQISWFIMALGFQFATLRLDFLSDEIKQLLQTVYFLLYLFVFTTTAWRVGDFAVDRFIKQNKETLNENLVAQMIPLLKRIMHFAILIVAGVILAAYFGIDVLAISAALGLSGFALALAAKDTITNIISGFVLMISQPFKVGDRIEVSSLDAWGDVTEIGMRSTTVIMRDNRMVIVPNSVIVDNVVVNYSRPDNTYRLETDIGVGAMMDIPEVHRVIREAVRKVDGVLQDKPVDVWFTEFGDSANTFRIRWWVATYADKRRVTDSVNATIQEVVLRENIDLPNPAFTVENHFQMRDEDIRRIVRLLKEPN
jgi:small-conductance mechanosensitive channel